mmetsp:Transcript_16997/g.24555  ORF Transcript_16997/g.24555 Transcript_16997/m.24555 type:complete len:112 (-) Transcript_16997:387-722(-)
MTCWVSSFYDCHTISKSAMTVTAIVVFSLCAFQLPSVVTSFSLEPQKSPTTSKVDQARRNLLNIFAGATVCAPSVAVANNDLFKPNPLMCLSFRSGYWIRHPQMNSSTEES